MADFASGLNAGMDFADRFIKNSNAREQSSAREKLFSLGEDQGRQLINQDVSNYDNQRASLFEGGYKPSEEENMALDSGAQTTTQQKPSERFLGSVVNMSSAERLGHMMTLAKDGGLKINDNTMAALQGVSSLFEKAKQDDITDATTKAATAEALRQRELENRKNMAAGQYLFNQMGGEAKFGANPDYEAIGTSATPFANILRGEEGNNIRMQLAGEKTAATVTADAIKAEDKITAANKALEDKKEAREYQRGTSQLIAGIGAQNNASNAENMNYFRQQNLSLAREKFDKDKEDTKRTSEEKALAAKQKLFQDRRKEAFKSLPKDLKTTEQQGEWMDYYAQHGVYPRVTVNKNGLFSRDTNNYDTKTPPKRPATTPSKSGAVDYKKYGF